MHLIKTIIITLALLSVAQFSFAADPMSAAELNTLLADKTVTAKHLIKGFTFKVYFDGKGQYVRSQNGNITEGAYSFKDRMHCVVYKGADRCATVVNNGDGTYKRMKNGKKHVIAWSDIKPGKQL